MPGYVVSSSNVLEAKTRRWALPASFVAAWHATYNGRSMATLITGATGFVGVNIVEELVGRGLDVVALGLGGWPAEAETNNRAADAIATWLPDGRKIAFHSNRDGNFEIYVINADGRGLTNLTNNPANDGASAWSPVQ